MIKWVFLILAAAAVVILVFFLLLIVPFSGQEDVVTGETEYEHHVQIAVSDADEYFWNQFKEGAKVAGDAEGVYVEFVPVISDDAGDLQKVVEMGIYADIDGIALQAVDDMRSNVIVKNAQEQDVQVVTYESGTYSLPNVPTVGSNYFTTGIMAGAMAAEAAKENAQAMVVLSKLGEDSDLQQQSLVLEGIESEGFRVADTKRAGAGLFESESLLEEILSGSNLPDVIICLDEKITPSIAQMLVDRGHVGEIRLIGYGAMPQTLDYIERGVIYGSVCPDAYQIGYETVAQLQGLLNGKPVSEYINPEMHRIDASNVNDYIEPKEQEQ